MYIFTSLCGISSGSPSKKMTGFGCHKNAEGVVAGSIDKQFKNVGESRYRDARIFCKLITISICHICIFVLCMKKNVPNATGK